MAKDQTITDMNAEIHDLREVNAKLVEACRAVVEAVEDAVWMSRLTPDRLQTVTAQCRAALAAAERPDADKVSARSGDWADPQT